MFKLTNYDVINSRMRSYLQEKFCMRSLNLLNLQKIGFSELKFFNKVTIGGGNVELNWIC